MKSHNPIILLFTSPPDTGHKTQLPESPLPCLGDVLEQTTGAFTVPLTRPVLYILLFGSFHEMDCILQNKQRSQKYSSLMK